ncbi:hypothetical protein KVT40_007244 [Elsinoe batatas]|uniref:Transcription factor CBF/NF-Y/archaeal histone domain-containing protein n=1 Tax=Elsinoe batatas TaxID=2601811 RepID=A0A8K0L489_9PEZI|nr:hypothetical protein KVT40_007244 [Elsinoe batatas]
MSSGPGGSFMPVFHNKSAPDVTAGMRLPPIQAPPRYPSLSYTYSSASTQSPSSHASPHTPYSAPSPAFSHATAATALPAQSTPATASASRASSFTAKASSSGSETSSRRASTSAAIRIDTPGISAATRRTLNNSDAWIANYAPVARLMKTALPENAKIAKEAKECLQECVSEFISFITSEAAEKCQQEKRKTVNGEDIIFAMTSLGFENYSEALKIYLSRYRETLVARGDQKAGAGGQGGNTSGGEYDTSNQDIMGGAMDNTQQGDYPYGVPGAAGDFQ